MNLETIDYEYFKRSQAGSLLINTILYGNDAMILVNNYKEIERVVGIFRDEIRRFPNLSKHILTYEINDEVCIIYSDVAGCNERYGRIYLWIKKDTDADLPINTFIFDDAIVYEQ